ncbi:hypothetical protein [Pontibacter sp. HJ8]
MVTDIIRGFHTKFIFFFTEEADGNCACVLQYELRDLHRHGRLLLQGVGQPGRTGPKEKWEQPVSRQVWQTKGFVWWNGLSGIHIVGYALCPEREGINRSGRYSASIPAR